MIMRPASEPCFDLGRLLGGIAVHDNMDFEGFGCAIVDLLEEVQELDQPVPLEAFADDEARSDVERCEQWRLPDVVVRSAFGYARLSWPRRAAAASRLHLRPEAWCH